jgi:nucleotidyltransferase-like protein
MTAFDPTDAVIAALRIDPLVKAVALVGSRANGTPTPLSDWDYHIISPDPAAVSLRLPDLTQPLEPLSQMWDPLARHPVYMLIVAAGPHVTKIDLLLDLPVRQPTPPPAVTLPGIDAHFWDWNLWLGSKRLRGTEELVRTQLTAMGGYLLKPMGGNATPATQPEAIAEYLRLRPLLEQQHNLRLAPGLGRAVRATLAANGLL